MVKSELHPSTNRTGGSHRDFINRRYLYYNEIYVWTKISEPSVLTPAFLNYETNSHSTRFHDLTNFNDVNRR